MRQLTDLLHVIVAACNAYIWHVKLQHETQIDQIEDEIDKLAAIGSPSAKLRIERLHIRKKRKSEQLGTL